MVVVILGGVSPKRPQKEALRPCGLRVTERGPSQTLRAIALRASAKG